MDIVETRRENLRRWIAQHGTPAKERSFFSQLKATASFGERVARRLEREYRMGDGYLDTPIEAFRPTPAGIIALHPEDPLPEGVIAVPESRIEFSAGPGREPHYELLEDSENATYRLSWFQKERINPARVKRFRVKGDSQEDFLFHNDTVLVNLDETNIVDGKLYAIRYENDLRIKFLFRKLNGSLVLHSKNSKYPDEEISPELANEHISIIGRVRDKSGKGGL